MDLERILAEVEDRLRYMGGLRGLMFLDPPTARRIASLEREAEENGAMFGLMPFVNDGVWAALGRQQQVALLLDKGSGLIKMTEELIQLRDAKGKVIGEWINPQRREELRGREDITFLSEDFVFYQRVRPEGEPIIILPEIDFPYLYGVEGIRDVTSGSPSGPADQFIRGLFNATDGNLLTHLVGFDLIP